MKYCHVLIGIIFLQGCIKGLTCKDDQLAISKTEVVGHQLRTDGFFFEDDSEKERVRVFLLYRNGVFFDALSYPYESASQNTLQLDLENSLLKRSKSSWGLFRIDSNQIEIEQWRSEINGCETTLYHYGEIIDDSTFTIYRTESRTNGDIRIVTEPNSSYRFRPLSEKPDSTNSFIK